MNRRFSHRLGLKTLKNEKILIVNDIAGAGKVAGNVVFPILSAAALEPAILPTLLLSTNIDADGEVSILSTNEIYTDYLDHWNHLGFKFTAYATGFFAEIDQITNFKDYYLKKKEEDPAVKLFVDPTMGDHGAIYPGFNPDVPGRIGELIEKADLVLPNITEACLLTGHPYKEPRDLEELKELAQKVNQLGAKNTIISGIQETQADGTERIGFFYYDEQGNSGKVLHKYFAGHFFGTGDLVFSLILSFFMKGLSIEDSIIHASKLTEEVLQDTVDLNREKIYGLYFEPMLANFMKDLAQHN